MQLSKKYDGGSSSFEVIDHGLICRVFVSIPVA